MLFNDSNHPVRGSCALCATLWHDVLGRIVKQHLFRFLFFFQLNVGEAKIYRKDQHEPRLREDEQMDIEEGEIPVSE